VTVHTYLKGATENSSHLHAAGMVLQSITNIRATPHRTRKPNNMFGVKAGKNMSVTCELRGEDMFHFLSKLVDVVLPKIKDWKGVAGTTGDGSGNLAFGLTPDEVALFPEIEINYDM
jgi:large subunit ribosomal protein L5